MHGTGTVSGLQPVAFIESKTCCAFVIDMQQNHHQGHQGQYDIQLSSFHIQRSGHEMGRGNSGLGKGVSGPPGPGTKERTSMMLCASSSVRMTGSPPRLASR